MSWIFSFSEKRGTGSSSSDGLLYPTLLQPIEPLSEIEPPLFLTCKDAIELLTRDHRFSKILDCSVGPLAVLGGARVAPFHFLLRNHRLRHLRGGGVQPVLRLAKSAIEEGAEA
jgi:hypothetical protein